MSASYCRPAYHGTAFGSAPFTHDGATSLYPAYTLPSNSYRSLPGGSRSQPRLRLPMHALSTSTGSSSTWPMTWPKPSSGPKLPFTVSQSFFTSPNFSMSL